jgi:hypothetical protein
MKDTIIVVEDDCIIALDVKYLEAGFTVITNIASVEEAMGLNFVNHAWC